MSRDDPDCSFNSGPAGEHGLLDRAVLSLGDQASIQEVIKMQAKDKIHRRRSRGIVIFPLLLIVLFALLFIQGFFDSIDYPVGRDTVANFGAGRFQVLRGENESSFLDIENQKTLVYDVADWSQRGDWVYVLGSDDRYLILDIRSGVHRFFDTLDACPLEDRHQLASLNRRNH